MIKVNLAELERLTEVLVKTAWDSEEVSGKLHHILSELQQEVSLTGDLSAEALSDSVSAASASLDRASEMLQSLKGIMLPVADMYRETEQKNKDALNRMAGAMESSGIDFRAAVLSDGLPKEEHTPAGVSQNEVRRLVSDRVEELQVANIAAITGVVQSEYEVKSLREFLPEE